MAEDYEKIAKHIHQRLPVLHERSKKMPETKKKLRRFHYRFRFVNEEDNTQRDLRVSVLQYMNFEKTFARAVELAEKQNAGKMKEIHILFKGG
jgi:hypothetical protein